MSRAPSVISGLLVAAAVAWTIHMGDGPDPFSVESGLVLGLSIVAGTLIAIVGLLLSRGRWSRVLALGIVAGEFALGIATPLSGWALAGIVLSGAALVGLLGPWLRGWLRRRPSAQGPGSIPMALMFASLSLVPAVALASPSELDPWHGVLAGAGVLLTWAYSRAQLWALWGLRVALVPLSIPAIVRSPWAGAVLLALLVGGITALAWTRAARLAVQPLMRHLPGPRIGTARDETGRP